MSIERDPARAPKRPDLTYLRHRARPAPPAPPPPPLPVTQRHPAPAPRPAPVAPAPTAPAPPPPPAPAAPPPASPSSSSLDLSDLAIPPATSAAPRSPAAPRRRPLHVREARRTVPGQACRLTAAEPTVTLNRLQSGTGALELVLTREAAAGDLSLGCAFALAEGMVSVVQALGDARTGPPGALLPLVRLRPQPDGETLTVDLRQVTGLRRALVYGYSPSVAVLEWHGVIVATTFGGARIEIPLSHPPFSGTLALLTIYNVDGELVLRTEMESFAGPPAVAAAAYDYHLPWLEGRRPVR